MKRLIILILSIVIYSSSYGQNKEQKIRYTTLKDSIELDTTKLRVGSISHLIQRARVANLAPSYASIMPFVPSIGNRLIPLEQGEGVDSRFNLLEAKLNLTFPLFLGKPITKKKEEKKKKKYKTDTIVSKWTERAMITFDYIGNFRMTLDNSKPLTPGDQKFGLTFFTSLWNNHNRSNTKIENKLKKKPDKGRNFKFVNFTLNAYHYSNGQAGRFFFYPDSINRPSFKRNNYKSGDFSSNYLNFMLTYGTYTPFGSLHQLSSGLRIDFGSTGDGALAFSEQQIRSYGLNRTFFIYDYRSSKGSSRLEYHVRGKIGYILGNLEQFQANLVNSRGEPDPKKYRFSLRLLTELNPTNHRAVGYFISLYYGRDYLNIRYDDIIFTTQLGVTLTFDKYKAPEPWF